MKLNSLLWLIGLTFLGACTSVTVTILSPQVQEPMVAGNTWGWGLGTGYVASESVTFVDDASHRPPDLQHPSTKSAEAFQGYASVGLGSRFQLGVQLYTPTFGSSLYGKFQILGDPSPESKAGNLPVAVFGRVGTSRITVSGDQEQTFGAGGFPWKATGNLSWTEAGASVGYQASDVVLVYGGYAMANYQGNINVTQDPSRDGSSQGGTYQRDENGTAQTASVGLHFWHRVGMGFAVDYTSFKWDNLDTTHDFGFMATFDALLNVGGGK